MNQSVTSESAGDDSLSPTEKFRPRRKTNRLVSVFGEVLITLGVVLGLFIVWQNWWTDVANEKVVKQERSAVLDDWGATMGPDGVIGPATPINLSPTLRPSGAGATGSATQKPRAHRGAAAAIGWPEFVSNLSRPTQVGTEDDWSEWLASQQLLPNGRLPVPKPTQHGAMRQPSKQKAGVSAKAKKVQTIGFMYAPALRKQRLWATPIVKGTSERALARGVGHYTGSADFGGIGNAAVAGHRTTHGAPFRHVDSLRRGDHVIVRVRDKWFVYVLDRSKIVRPKDHWVLRARPIKSNSGRLLTLTTCHPLHSAARRFVWWGHLVRTLPASGPPPAELKLKR